MEPEEKLAALKLFVGFDPLAFAAGVSLYEKLSAAFKTKNLAAWQLDNGVHLGLNHLVMLKVLSIKESTYLQALFLGYKVLDKYLIAAKKVCVDKKHDQKLEKDVCEGKTSLNSPWSKIGTMCGAMGIPIPSLEPPGPSERQQEELEELELEELELEELEELQSELEVEPSDPQTESALQEQHSSAVSGVIEWLDSLGPGDMEKMTNAKVLEVLDLEDKTARVKLLSLVINMSGIHPSWKDHHLNSRFSNYFYNSKSRHREVLEEQPNAVWEYLVKVVRGELHKPAMLVPKVPQHLSKVARLLRKALEKHGDCEQQCEHCKNWGDHDLCGCMEVVFCSVRCQEMEVEHTMVCVKMEEKNPMLLRRSDLRHRQRANCMTGVVKKKQKQLRRMLDERAEKTVETKKLHNKLEVAAKKLAKARATLGQARKVSLLEQQLASVHSPRKGDSLVAISVSKQEGVAKLVPLPHPVLKLWQGQLERKPDPVLPALPAKAVPPGDPALPAQPAHQAEADLPVQAAKPDQVPAGGQAQGVLVPQDDLAPAPVDVVDAPGPALPPAVRKSRTMARERGEREKAPPRYTRRSKGVFVELGIRHRPFSKLSDTGKAIRARMLLGVAELLACGPKQARDNMTAEQRREELLDLLCHLSKQNKTLFKELLNTHRAVIAHVMMLTPQKASSLQHSLKLSLSQRRKLSTACLNLFGFTFLPGEKQQQKFEEEVCKAFSNDKLQRGSMLLLKSTKDPAPRSCYYAKIGNLSEFLEGEVRNAAGEEFEDPNIISNILSPRYKGMLRVTIGGDKGGQTTKITIILGGGREPLCIGLYYGTDCSANLLRFFGDWTDQLRELLNSGLNVRLETGSALHLPIELLLNGDMMFASEILGHSGSASTFPSLYRLIGRKHFQNEHRNGEPHLPTREACQADFREMEQMARDYSENLAASNNCSDRMRKNAAKHNSIKGPQIIPLRSVWHIVPSGLHITLFMGPAAIALMEGWCDVLEEEVDETVLARIADILEVEEEPSGEVVEDEEAEPEETAATITEPTGVKRGYSESRLKLEKEGQKALLEVTKADLHVQQVNEEALRRMNILRRVQGNLEADILKRAGKAAEAKSKWLEMEEIARSENKIKRSLIKFGFCTSLCLMTWQDHNIKWEICSSCRLSCHSQCELWDALEDANPPAPAAVTENGGESGSESDDSSEEEDVATARVQEDPRICNNCRATKFKDYEEMKSMVLPWVEAGQAKLLAAQVVLERARAEQQLVADKLKNLVGDRRKELARILEEDLHVVKTAYQGGQFVGNHCHRILMHHEQLSVVLASTSRPELQADFNLFCSTYLRIHHLMKAARWLTEEELDALEEDCLAVGTLWPKIFAGSSIKPKLDVLIFVVPAFARKWGTLGGLGEERLEAIHQVFNEYSRILAPMRDKGELLAVGLKREAALKAAGICTIPRKRKWKNRNPKFSKKQLLD